MKQGSGHLSGWRLWAIVAALTLGQITIGMVRTSFPFFFFFFAFKDRFI